MTTISCVVGAVFFTGCAAYTPQIHQRATNPFPIRAEDAPIEVVNGQHLNLEAQTMASAIIKSCGDESETFRVAAVEVADKIDWGNDVWEHGPVKQIATVVFKNNRKNKQTASRRGLVNQIKETARQLGGHFVLVRKLTEQGVDDGKKTVTRLKTEICYIECESIAGHDHTPPS